MDKQPVGQLPDLTQSNNDDEIMVITNSEYNQLKKEKISDFITDLQSTNTNNSLTTGSDGKLFVSKTINASDVDGVLSLDNIPQLSTNKLPETGISADNYSYPSSITVNDRGQVVSITEGSAAEAGAYLDQSQITNCILEIPQKIKIEHDPVTATLTLKAGSILIVPYGLEDLSTTITVGSTFIHENFIVSDTRYNAGKFFVWVEVQNDISSNVASPGIFIRPVVVHINNNSLIAKLNTSSAATGLSSGTGVVYRTDLNYVKDYNSGIEAAHVLTFPFAEVKSDEEYIYRYIANVFQGIGHIGNVSWCDKDIKVLFGNGRDKDGNFINIEHTKNQISLTPLTSSYLNKPYYLSITPDTSEEDGNLFQASLDSYIVSETQPTVSDSTSVQRWYNPSENKFYIFTQ